MINRIVARAADNRIVFAKDNCLVVARAEFNEIFALVGVFEFDKVVAVARIERIVFAAE